MISRKEYDDLKELATFIQLEIAKLDPIKHPETISQYNLWVSLIYRIMKFMDISYL